MKMYHKLSKQPVDVQPSQVETMKHRGWVDKKPEVKPTITKKADK
jgi:hypothetical protein